MNDPSVRELQAAIGLIEWYREAGIHSALLEQPRDRFAETAREAAALGAKPRRAAEAQEHSPPSSGRSAPTPARREAQERSGQAAEASRPVVPDDVAIADARERARSAASLDELLEALAGFTGCNLRLTSSSLVFGEGDPHAALMLVGEAPGREEDIAGVPFVGRSGKLLDRMLHAIGLERDAVRVTNTVPWRPPGNRPPTPAETELCLPFVQRQIELVRPKVLVCLGSPAAKALLRSQEGILRVRGRWQSYAFGVSADESIPAMAMLHPAYLLRQPAQKRLAWRDLLALKQRLDEIGRD